MSGLVASAIKSLLMSLGSSQTAGHRKTVRAGIVAQRFDDERVSGRRPETLIHLFDCCLIHVIGGSAKRFHLRQSGLSGLAAGPGLGLEALVECIAGIADTI